MEQSNELDIDILTSIDAIPELKNFNTYDTICMDRNLNDTIEILKKYGGPVKKFTWSDCSPLTSSDVIEVLNLMPLLEEISVDSYKPIKIDKSSAKLNLPYLKSLHVQLKELFVFYCKILPPHSLNKLVVLIDDEIVLNSEEYFFFEYFLRFIKRQKSIKVCEIDYQMPLDALNLLTLDELKLGRKFKTNEVLKVLKCQPELKTLECEGEIDLETFNEVFGLSKLEVLKINVKGIKNGEKLGKLKNLKHLEIKRLCRKSQQSFFTFNLESLEKLNISYCDSIDIPDILETIASNFPNLKILELESSQKLNFFAKIFPKLEELTLYFNGENFCEPDTGIVNQNLRKLDFFVDKNICEEILEILITFPNLEVLKIETHNYSWESNFGSNIYLTDKNIFVKLHEMENLKSLEMGKFTLKNSEIDLLEIAEEFKKLLRKLDFVKFRFIQKLRNEIELDRLIIISGYEFLTNSIKEDFKVLNHVNSERVDLTFSNVDFD